MSAVHYSLPDERVVRVPEWVIDNASFLRWAESDEVFDQRKIGYFNGTVWIDSTMEQILHNEIKAAIAEVLRQWNRQHALGHYYPDGMVFTNVDCELSTVPDGIFVAAQSLTDGTVVRERGIRSTKLIGSPDLVLEVVSRSSVEKDLQQFPQLYYEAGVRECWLVDSRVDNPALKILARGSDGFEEVPASDDGWVHSEVLQGSFRLSLDVVREEARLEAK